MRKAKSRRDVFKHDMSQFECGAHLPKAKPRKAHQSLIDKPRTIQALSSVTGIRQPKLQSILDWNAAKVDIQNRDDFWQDMSLSLLENRPNDERLAFAICRARLADFYRHNSRVRYHEVDSLNQVTTDDDGEECEVIDLVAGEVEFECKLQGKIMADTIFNQLDFRMKRIVAKRLLAIKLNARERQYAHRFPSTERGKTIQSMSQITGLKRFQ